MTQPAVAVGGEAAPVEPTNPADAFTQLAEEEFGVTDEEEPAEGDPAEGAEDDLEIEEEADDLPPIDAPVSWDAEAKKVFEALPRDAQEIVQKREADRERFVQQKSQEATQARQTATQQAQAELAQMNAVYAQQLQEVAASLQASEPDPMLQVSDPIAYAQQMRAYQQANAQRTHAQRLAVQHAQQAQAMAYQAEQGRLAQEHQTIVESFPEYADPTTGPELQRKLSATAKRIGYPDELISQARATDIIAMKKVSDAFDKADKYDALQSNKMAKVRAARGLPRVATPGVAQGSDQLRASRASAAIDKARTSKNRDVAGQGFYDYLKNTGQI